MILKDLLEKVNIVKAEADMDIEIHGISFDTRSLKAGELFVAIRGIESDGHDYIQEAVEKGAVCVICEQPPDIATPYILVENARKALALTSAKWFGEPAQKLKMIGVTGTNGKTTVTSLIKNVLEKCTGGTVGLIGTNAVMIGNKELPAERTTPESYEIQQLLAEMVSAGCEYVVMEVSSHALCLDRVHGIEFEVGVYTNLSQDHLDFHGTMENYAKAKALLFTISKAAAINLDDEYAQIMIDSATCPVMTYAIDNGDADLVAKSIRLHAEKVDFCALMIGHLHRAELNIPGMISVYNALSAMSAALLLGFDIESISMIMKTCGGVKGRAEIVPVPRDFTVMIDYAHTPDALKNIIKTVRGFAKGRVVTLFGCGGDRDREKRPLMGKIAAELSDFVIVTSDNPRTEEPGEIIEDILAGIEGKKPPRRVIENRREAIHWALENTQPGDVIILAGKGHETYQIIGKDKTHFDEREVVAEYFIGNP
ncbi:MAG: UDP-N-acetylmuramoyl-L-alanyl-D-glutamate--2,6-diaminopimelate ligase [Oscillospiraceae bacterium]|nr:UDP-N-acetylmuramoyl-L-alanyl-D-glutamate--2,6-diaminopimelate ligase [Oscillospiraceae bacterium]